MDSLDIGLLDPDDEVENLGKIIDLLEQAHARGDLDTIEHIERLKVLAAQLPGADKDRRRWLRIVVALKRELYEFSATLAAKVLKEFS